MHTHHQHKTLKIHTKRYPSSTGSTKVSILINMDDFLMGYLAGLAGEPRLPDMFILDFCAWHIAYEKGTEARGKINNMKNTLY